MKPLRKLLRTVRTLNWAAGGFVCIALLAWWFYSAPAHLVGRIRSALDNPEAAGAGSLVAIRVDFTQVNENLSGDLHSATDGHLDAAGFSHLLRYGWIEGQKAKASDLSQQTRLYRVRYRDLNRFMALYWDPGHVHEVILTLERKSVLERWYVTAVRQFNVCAYDFDCALVAASTF